MQKRANFGLVSLLLICLLLLPVTAAQAQSEVFYRGQGVCRDIALTYDTEFSQTTQALIDTIDGLGIRTTWFFAGDSVESYPALVQQVSGRHQVGNHTQNHLELPKESPATIRQQFALSEARIIAVAGTNPRPVWRPPYGAYNDTVLAIAEEQGYPITAMWSIDTRDWDGPSVEMIRRRIVNGAFPGAISLQHGFPANTVEATRLAVGDLRALGYQFLTVTEILGIDRDLRDFGGETYVVQAGDSFDGVGRCHNLTGSRLAAYNEVDDLAQGDRFQIPHRDEVIIRRNGERLAFPVYPRVQDGRAMAHVRLAERLGATVEWTGSAAVVMAEGIRIEVTPGERMALVNGQPFDMGAAAFMESDRVLLPARFLVERLGWRVDWVGETWTVSVSR